MLAGPARRRSHSALAPPPTARAVVAQDQPTSRAKRWFVGAKGSRTAVCGLSTMCLRVERAGARLAWPVSVRAGALRMAACQPGWTPFQCCDLAESVTGDWCASRLGTAACALPSEKHSPGARASTKRCQAQNRGPSREAAQEAHRAAKQHDRHRRALPTGRSLRYGSAAALARFGALRPLPPSGAGRLRLDASRPSASASA